MGDDYFYQFETAAFTLHFRQEGVLQNVAKVVVSFEQSDNLRVVLDEGQVSIDAENSEISLTLTQRQSGRLSEGTAKIQVNIYYLDARRHASGERCIEVKHNQFREVMR